ncbi:MAG: oligosaccharide flippase family protein [Bacilli bacterium]|jgi:O-antigen/teichoic acid export membrane protein|nr:oligosaccharide flippase family protein [Bacilli bacterium]
MSKNTLLKGAMWGTLAVFLSKVLGFIYLIPFNKFLNVNEQIIFTSSYRIYAYVLLIATAGIPFATANLIAKYNAHDNYHISFKILKITTIIMFIIGFICFVVLFSFALPIARLIVTSSTNGNVINNVSVGIKIIASALIIVPLLSVVRGFFQGYKEIQLTSMSQLIEQMINSGFILAALFLAGGGIVKNIDAVYFAILCATLASIGSLLYLIRHFIKLKSMFSDYLKKSNYAYQVSNRMIIKQIIAISIPYIVVVLLAQSNDLIDLMYTIRGLVAHGFNIEQAKEFSTVYGASVIKLLTIPLTISTGLSVALVPHLAEAYARADMKSLKITISKIMEATIVFLIPITLLMLATKYETFYIISPNRNAQYGASIFNYFAVYAIINTFAIIIDNMMLTLEQRKRALVFISISTIFKLSATYFLIKYFGILGLALSSIIACLISTVPSMIVLKNVFKLRYYNFIRCLIISIVCSGAMMIIVIGIGLVIPQGNYLMMFLKTGLLYIIGILVYGILALKLNIIPSEIKNKIISKLS